MYTLFLSNLSTLNLNIVLASSWGRSCGCLSWNLNEKRKGYLVSCPTECIQLECIRLNVHYSVPECPNPVSWCEPSSSESAKRWKLYEHMHINYCRFLFLHRVNYRLKYTIDHEPHVLYSQWPLLYLESSHGLCLLRTLLWLLLLHHGNPTCTLDSLTRRKSYYYTFIINCKWWNAQMFKKYIFMYFPGM